MSLLFKSTKFIDSLIGIVTELEKIESETLAGVNEFVNMTGWVSCDEDRVLIRQRASASAVYSHTIKSAIIRSTTADIRIETIETFLL